MKEDRLGFDRRGRQSYLPSNMNYSSKRGKDYLEDVPWFLQVGWPPPEAIEVGPSCKTVGLGLPRFWTC